MKTQIVKMIMSGKVSMSSLSSSIQGKLNEKFAASEAIIDTVLHFCVPLTHQFFIQVAENGPDATYFYPAPYATEYPLDDYYRVTEKVRADCVELLKIDSIRNFMRVSSQGLRKKINKILDYKDKIKLQITSFNKFLAEKLLPKVPECTALNFLKWISIVNTLLILD